MSEFADCIFLTGAGFTADFGGLLASEMWSRIFNHPGINKFERLKNLPKNDMDYESIYYKVVSSDRYTPEEKEAMKIAITDAYKYIDKRIFETCDNSPSQVINDCRHGLRDLIEAFHKIERKKSKLFFTLNQDIFIERFSFPTNLPGPRNINIRSNFEFRNGPELPDKVRLPDRIENIHESIQPGGFPVGDIQYIKLHGSFQWLSFNPEEEAAMVIGLDKVSRIKDEPLLKCYFEMFEQQINRPNVKLLIVGYGFRDKHVNKAIANAINNNSIQLFVVMPIQFDTFEKALRKVHRKCADTLIRGIQGYYPTKFSEILSDIDKRTELKKSLGLFL